jgi:hypothetical protein
VRSRHRGSCTSWTPGHPRGVRGYDVIRMGICDVTKEEVVVRHVSVTDGGHGDDGPPEAVRNGFEVGLRRARLRKVHCA